MKMRIQIEKPLSLPETIHTLGPANKLTRCITWSIWLKLCSLIISRLRRLFSLSKCLTRLGSSGLNERLQRLLASVLSISLRSSGPRHLIVCSSLHLGLRCLDLGLFNRVFFLLVCCTNLNIRVIFTAHRPV